MSPTPTPTPSPVFKDEAIVVHSSLSDALAQQQQIHNEMVSSSTLTPAESAAFDSLMGNQPANNAVPIVAGIVLSVLVLVAAAVAFIRHRRAGVTSPATAEVSCVERSYKEGVCEWER